MKYSCNGCIHYPPEKKWPCVDCDISIHDRYEDEGKHWEMSDKYKGYACCPVCMDTFIEPDWIIDMKWRFCPTCGTRLYPPKEE